jgi:hypothetical protein
MSSNDTSNIKIQTNSTLQRHQIILQVLKFKYVENLQHNCRIVFILDFADGVHPVQNGVNVPLLP